MANDNPNTAEIWLPLPEAETLYEISSLGRVRHIKKNRINKTCVDKKGYVRISLRIDDGRSKFLQVHRLVAIAFLGIYPDLQVNHKDGNKQNNRVENLEWVTYAQNRQHAVEHKLHNYGEQVNTAKLRGEQVKEIRRLYSNGATLKAISSMYGVRHTTIWNVVTRASWKHIE